MKFCSVARPGMAGVVTVYNSNSAAGRRCPWWSMGWWPGDVVVRGGNL
jgi:hypothetical protein